LILWCNRQTVAYLILRTKPRNCHSDFEGQITKPPLSVLMPKPENLTNDFEVKQLTNHQLWF
jgi:hypothetical protein